MSIDRIADSSRKRTSTTSGQPIATVVAYAMFVVSFAFAAAMVLGLVP